MSSRRANYAKLMQLCKQQVVFLEILFEKGMKSTTRSEMIQAAAEETSLPVKKIEV